MQTVDVAELKKVSLLQKQTSIYPEKSFDSSIPFLSVQWWGINPHCLMPERSNTQRSPPNCQPFYLLNTSPCLFVHGHSWRKAKHWIRISEPPVSLYGIGKRSYLGHALHLSVRYWETISARKETKQKPCNVLYKNFMLFQSKSWPFKEAFHQIYTWKSSLLMRTTTQPVKSVECLFGLQGSDKNKG